MAIVGAIVIAFLLWQQWRFNTWPGSLTFVVVIVTVIVFGERASSAFYQLPSEAKKRQDAEIIHQELMKRTKGSR